MLCLAALVLLGAATGPWFDLRLAPDVSPQLARLMLGELQDNTMTGSEAEAFAFLVLDQERPARPVILVRRDLRRLRPLHDALRRPVPQAADHAVPNPDPGGRFQLHRQVIEIRDAMLALRPYRDPRVAGTCRQGSALIRACGSGWLFFTTAM